MNTHQRFYGNKVIRYRKIHEDPTAAVCSTWYFKNMGDAFAKHWPEFELIAEPGIDEICTDEYVYFVNKDLLMKEYQRKSEAAQQQ